MYRTHNGPQRPLSHHLNPDRKRGVTECALALEGRAAVLLLLQRTASLRHIMPILSFLLHTCAVCGEERVPNYRARERRTQATCIERSSQAVARYRREGEKRDEEVM